MSQSPGLVYSSDMESNSVADPKVIRCEVCQAVARALIPKIEALVPRQYKGGRMVAIAQAIEDVCTPDSFRVYEFSPPDMIEACRSFRSDYEDELEELAGNTKKKPNDAEWRKTLCGAKDICQVGMNVVCGFVFGVCCIPVWVRASEQY